MTDIRDRLGRVTGAVTLYDRAQALAVTDEAIRSLVADLLVQRSKKMSQDGEGSSPSQ